MVKYSTISDKNRRISLQSATITKSDSGQPTKTWTTYATVWSYIRTMTGREKFAAEQVKAVMSHEITIRYSSETDVIKNDDRILYGTRIFDIKDIRNVDEANIEIRMLCTEAV